MYRTGSDAMAPAPAPVGSAETAGAIVVTDGMDITIAAGYLCGGIVRVGFVHATMHMVEIFMAKGSNFFLVQLQAL